MRPDPTENSDSERNMAGRRDSSLLGLRSVGVALGWLLAGCLACAIGAAIAAPAPAPAPKSAAKGPATATQQTKKDEGFQTAATTAILIDSASGSVLFEKNADQLGPPPSLSKLMTTEVVLNEIKQGRLKPTDEFIVSENAWRKGGAPSHT